MRKRILIAEAGDTVRQAAETVLRQHGFEVISVPSAEKAREVLNFARPDLLLVGGSLQTADQRLFYDRLHHDPKTSSLPMLVLEPSDKKSLDWPGELVVHQPIDPKELIDKVTTFVAHSAARSQPVRKEESPIGGTDVSDAFLDEALGLDKLDVTKSEMFDGTTKIRKGPKVTKDATIGYEHSVEEDLSDSSRVESLVIRDDKGEIHHHPAGPQPPVNTNSTGSLEIMKDQYGLTDPAAFKQSQAQQQDADHDYNWFVNAMREENTQGGKPKPASDSSRIAVTKTSALVDPVTPGPGGAAAAKRTEGVEKFIDEFKKEIEQLRSNDVEPLSSVLPPGTTAPSEKQLPWEEKLEKLSGEEIDLFTREFAHELGDRIAERIIAKIDSDKLLQMLKDEILARARKK